MQENLSPWADARAPHSNKLPAQPGAEKNGVLHHFSSLRTGLEGAFGRAIGALWGQLLTSGSLPLGPGQGVPPLLDRFLA